mgnify:CR=1 FL=1
MAECEILRGKVLSYPAEKNKGLVEVSIGAYDKSGDTVYARVEQGMSGVYWLPEIGDVVEVELPTHPGGEPRIIHIHRPGEDEQTGACWTEKNDVKQFLTRSGHRVTLDDTKDHTAITIHTSGGLELKLEDEAQTVTLCAAEKETPVLLLDVKNDAVRLSAGKELTISCGGASIAFDSDGNITVKAKGTLDMSGKDVKVSATQKSAVKGQSVELSGTQSVKVEGKGQLDLTSSGMT